MAYFPATYFPGYFPARYFPLEAEEPVVVPPLPGGGGGGGSAGYWVRPHPPRAVRKKTVRPGFDDDAEMAEILAMIAPLLCHS